MKSLKKLGRDVEGNRTYQCPFCGDVVTMASNTFFGRCPACEATVIDYAPKPHQMDFHKSKAKYRLNVGGFGSGKTTMCCAELAKHAMSVANGRSLITAPILKQVKDAVLPELNKFIPPWMIEKFTNAPSPRYILTNGHEILIYASNDEQNLRSLNLTSFYIEEASNVNYDVFVQLTTRLRNTSALILDENGKEIGDRFMGLVSSNPDDAWIRDRMLLISDKIFTSKSIDRATYDMLKVKHPVASYHSFLSSTRDNDSLPHTFIQDVCAGKSLAWIRKYIDCYLDIKEGAVYPNFFKAVVQPFPIPKTWKRIFGFDKGYRDQTAMTCGAINPVTGVIYVYDEYYVAEKPMSYHAQELKKYFKDVSLYLPIQADPTVCSRNERDGQTYQGYFYAISGGSSGKGIWLEPANNSIITGIDKVRDYIYTDKLKFFTTCDSIKGEARDYVYPDKSTARTSKQANTPLDRKNHLMDALRYMISPLPENPEEFNMALIPDLGNFSGFDYDSFEIQEEGEGYYGGFKL